VIAALVAAFLGVFFGIGAVTRSTASQTASGSSASATALPFVPWYWTMAAAPSDPNVLVLGTSGGLYRSSDGGKTWAPTGPKDVDFTSVVQAAKSLYAAGLVSSNPSPVIRKGTGRTAPDGTPLLALSTDGGATWQELQPKGLPSSTVQSLAVDPSSSSSLYALLNTGSLYRSTDAGHTFAPVASKVGISPWALAITKGSRFVGGDMDSGSHVSANAKVWKVTPFRDGRGGSMVMEYAVDPTNPSNVLMTSVGIERSSNGGKTWQPALKSSVMFGPVAWASSSVAYAVGFDRSLWRSTDGGRTWHKLA